MLGNRLFVCVGVVAPVTGLKVKTVPPPWEERRCGRAHLRLRCQSHGLSLCLWSPFILVSGSCSL